MSLLVAGIDEVATERQLLEGWTYYILPEGELGAFEKAIQGIAVSSTRAFHGKKFKKAQATEYEAFLRALRAAVEQSGGPARAVFTLNETSWKAQLLPHLSALVTTALRENGLPEEDALPILTKLFPGLATLQRLVAPVGSDYSLRLEIDQDDVTRALPSTVLSVQGGQLPLERVLVALYRGYRARLFPESPSLLDLGGVTVLRDGQSRLIQAADVFGNFAMSYALHHLGDPSTTRAVKADVFARVFGDVVSPGMVTSAAVLQGNEMTSNQAGALTLVVSAE